MRKTINRLAIILFLLFTASLSKAQHVSIEWSPLQKKSVPTKIDLLSYDETGFSLFGYEKKGWGLFYRYDMVMQKFDSNFKKINSSEIKTLHDDLFLICDRMHFEFGDKSYLIARYFDKKRKNIILYKQQIDKNLSENSEWEEFTRVDANKAGDFENIIIKQSLDKTKLLVFYDEFKSAKKLSKKLTLQLFDSDFKKIYDNKVTLPYINKELNISDFLLTDEGKVIMLAKVAVNQSGKNSPNYKFSLLNYDQQKGLDNIEIDPEKKFITTVKFAFIPTTQKVIVLGFYREESASNIIGTLYKRVDLQTGNIELENVLPFVVLNDEKYIKKSKEPLYEYQPREIILRDDGKIDYIIEEYRLVERTTTSYNGQSTSTRTTSQYYYKDIICYQFDENGNSILSFKIKKLQRTLNDEGAYSSFSFNNDNGIYSFFYYDNPKNLTKKVIPGKNDKAEEMNDLSKAIYMNVNIDREGTMTRHKIIKSMKEDKNDDGTLIQSTLTKKVGENEFFMLAVNGDKYKYGKLTIKNND